MSEAEAVKALREWCALPPCDRNISLGVMRWTDGTHDHEAVRALQRLIESAPALLARIEAGEGLLREARDDLYSLGMTTGHPLGSKSAGREADAIHARIDAFLAAKEGVSR